LKSAGSVLFGFELLVRKRTLKKSKEDSDGNFRAMSVFISAIAVVLPLQAWDQG